MFEGFAISARFLLTYPDGSREHINRETRDHLLLSFEAKQTAPGKYRFIGQPKTFHSFGELGEFYRTRPELGTGLRRFLPGRFTFELRQHRIRELMESPEGMAYRLVRDRVCAAT